MDNFQVFSYSQTVTVRMVMQGDEPWWVLADVCKVLGLAKPDRVASRLDDDEKGATFMSTLGGPQKMTVINESGLYTVILRSNKPEAKAFKRWVTHEVLPTIRRSGEYALSDQVPHMAMIEANFPQQLPPTARALWFTLLWLEQSQGGRGTAVVSNMELIPLLGVSGHQALNAARKALIRCGYISYEQGVKARPSTYTLLKVGDRASRAHSVY